MTDTITTTESEKKEHDREQLFLLRCIKEKIQVHFTSLETIIHLKEVIQTA